MWMALAMMVKTRLWLGGEVSEQRDMPLIRRTDRAREALCGPSSLVRLPVPMAWCLTFGPYGRPFASPRTRGKADGPGCVRGAMS